MTDNKPFVLLACPHYGEIHARTVMALLEVPQQGIRVRFALSGMSALAYNFNTLWCIGLNGRQDPGFTHFCMIHSDIVPGGSWLLDLMNILEEQRADVVSVAVPIKDGQGIVSAGLDMGTADDPWRRRRLTMHELHRLPETFDHHDLARLWDAPTENALLFNTGLWLAKLGPAWPEQIRFTMQDRIEKCADGVFKPRMEPEDWDFSKQVHRMGLRAVCTRRVPVNHLGGLGYTNAAPWGLCGADPCWVGEEAAHAAATEGGILVEV